MWALTHRIGIVIVAGLLAISPLRAQPKENATRDFWTTENGVWTQEAAAVFGAEKPFGAIAAMLHIGENPVVKVIGFQYWQTNQGLEMQAALHVIGAGNPVGALAVRVRVGEPNPHVFLEEWQFVFDEPLPLYHGYLERIKDRRPLRPFLKMEPVDLAWYRAFCQALTRSHEADLAKFKKAAEPNKFVHIARLLAAPDQFRGKIITVKGRLTLIREEDTPRYVSLNDVPHIYTGWIEGPKGTPPYSIAFTELPEGIEPSEKHNLEVTFQGYFLSLVRYPDKANPKNDTITPYLVGKTLIIHGENKPAVPIPPEGNTSYSYPIILATVSAMVGVAILVALMNVWLKRGDRKIHEKLAAMRDRQRPFNIEPDVETGIQPGDAPSGIPPS